MKFIGQDYTVRITDKAGIIPENEPCFLFRAQDKHFAQTMRHYAWLLRHDGNEELAERVNNFVLEIENWQSTVKRKTPDIPVQTKIEFNGA
jgi:hypothetical protein